MNGDALGWTLLHLLAWVFGLWAVLELYREGEPGIETTRRLGWAVGNCLLMEVAMLAAPLLAGADLAVATTGIAAAALIWSALCQLSAELAGRPPRRGWSDRWLALLTVGLSTGPLAAGWAAPEATRRVTEIARPLEGAAWVVVSAAAIVLLLSRRFRSLQHGSHAASSAALAFGFALADSLIAPFGAVTGVEVPRPASSLLSSLFILTLVTTLFGTVLRLRGHRLAAALQRLHTMERDLLGLEKLVAVGTLAAGAAHDFNNSLTVISGFVELAFDDPSLDPSTRESLLQVQHAADGARATAAGLLGLARQRAPASYATLTAAVAGPLEMISSDLRRRGIEVVRQLAEVDAAADPALLSQVCLNLYLNARDAMEPKGGGLLEVELVRSEAACEIRVRDNGVGVSAAFRDRLFQPLATTKGEKGTGLGLATSRSIVESMGGTILCESVEGEGATFMIRLPLAAVEKRLPRSETTAAGQ